MGRFLEKYSGILVAALILIGSVRIVATYYVFSHTFDEPAHIACGMEWLDKGVYRWEPQHPPLARVAAALGPYLSGVHSQGTRNTGDPAEMQEEGLSILYAGKHYDRTLALARLGILPFFWIASLVVYWWGRRYFGASVAAVAVFLFTFLPPILAHAGLATTDMALTAFLTLSFVAGLVWVERPTVTHGIWFGLATGFMVLSKFSCLVFFPAIAIFVALGYLALERPGPGALANAARRRIPTFVMAVAIGFLVIWAGYRFSFGKIPFANISLPFPELYAGIQQVQEHAARGHPCYLLGEISDKGFWNFYLVGLAYKSPLAFLGLVGAGPFLIFGKDPLCRRLWIPLAFSGGILAVGVFSTINIGIRHVLPIYAGLSLMAAVAAMKLLAAGQTKKWVWGLLGVSMLWMMLASVMSHPDYLPYFNELAGSEPENILVDSDLDWGQDTKRLGIRLHQGGATSVTYAYFVWARLVTEQGFPEIRHPDRYRPSEGWNAIGVTLWKRHRTVVWPDQIKPMERVGKSILLWYFPPGVH